jgi:hypothetical protein
VDGQSWQVGRAKIIDGAKVTPKNGALPASAMRCRLRMIAARLPKQRIGVQLPGVITRFRIQALQILLQQNGHALAIPSLLAGQSQFSALMPSFQTLSTHIDTHQLPLHAHSESGLAQWLLGGCNAVTECLIAAWSHTNPLLQFLPARECFHLLPVEAEAKTVLVNSEFQDVHPMWPADVQRSQQPRKPIVGAVAEPLQGN